MARSCRKNKWHGSFLLERLLFFWCWFCCLKTVSAGSLTRRCGRGESAVRGCAVGFRVGHGEGHWAGHWGRWRQQEGAWHFALAAPVWLQTTQIGSGGRHATTRRHGMETGRGSKGRVQIKHGEGGEGSDGGRRRWETPTEGMRNADNICHHGSVKINRHHKNWLKWDLEREGRFHRGGVGWRRCGEGRRKRFLFDWVYPANGKKLKPWENTRLHNHNTTNKDTNPRQPNSN